ncbi:MAG: hypothetical protein COT73_09105 [Bdellovibrio sp. CG10_big_fil_rev_8_21_14_0_10_47_8]|nr:MAG: hypothetical protein COT73_09105 [Bdellovibrio sp. CG10_big_fil_rev_8_21_14_0_10_47_8]
MAKVLLIFEDYTELALTEVYLKRVGFDVMGISNEMGITEKVLTFNPDVIVAFGKGPKVSSFSVGQKLRENFRFGGKAVIVVPKDLRPNPDQLMKMKVDAMLEAPIVPEKLIQILCRMTGLSSELYLDKFQKARLKDPELQQKLTMVTGSAAAGSESAGAPLAGPNSSSKVAIDDKGRVEKYSQYIQNISIDVQETTHRREEIREKQKELKKGWDFNLLDEIDRLKRQFAEALFKK